MKINVPNGEIVDRYTILEIKLQNIDKTHTLHPIFNQELKTLLPYYLNIQKKVEIQLIDRLRLINKNLWTLENEIRRKIKEFTFDNEFINYSKQICLLNDERAALKEKINQITGCTITSFKKIYS